MHYCHRWKEMREIFFLLLGREFNYRSSLSAPSSTWTLTLTSFWLLSILIGDDSGGEFSFTLLFFFEAFLLFLRQQSLFSPSLRMSAIRFSLVKIQEDEKDEIKNNKFVSQHQKTYLQLFSYQIFYFCFPSRLICFNIIFAPSKKSGTCENKAPFSNLHFSLLHFSFELFSLLFFPIIIQTAKNPRIAPNKFFMRILWGIQRGKRKI